MANGQGSAAPSFERMVAGMSETMRHVLVNSPATLDHLKEARATFEMTVTQIAARKRTPADVVDFHAILAEQESGSFELNAFLRADGRSHHRIAFHHHPGQSNLRQPEPGAVAWLSQFHFDLVRGPVSSSSPWRSTKGILEAIEARRTRRGRPSELRTIEPRQASYNQANFVPEPSPGCDGAGRRVGWLVGTDIPSLEARSVQLELDSILRVTSGDD